MMDRYAWLRDVLDRMVDGHPAQRFNESLPWNQAQTLHAGLVVNEPVVQFDGR